jgi:hypothetical protein
VIKSSLKRLRQDRLKIVETVQEGERGESKGKVVGGRDGTDEKNGLARRRYGTRGIELCKQRQ